MKTTKKQIVTGVTKYAKKEIIDKITDKPLKMIIAAAVSALELNPALVDNIFSNDILAGIVHKDGDQYDLGDALRIAEKTLDDYGDFPVVIPAIKFISPEEKELTFSASDVRKLKNYIVGGDADD